MLPQNMHPDLLTISSWRNWERMGTGKISWPSSEAGLKPLSGEVHSQRQRRDVSTPPRSQGCKRNLDTRTLCCPFSSLSHFPTRLSTLHQIHAGWNTSSAFISSQSFLCCVRLTLNTVVCFLLLMFLLFFRGPSRQLGRVEEKSIFPLLQLQIKYSSRNFFESGRSWRPIFFQTRDPYLGVRQSAG